MSPGKLAPNFRPNARIACAAVLLVLLGALTYEAVIEGLSNVYVENAAWEMEHWGKPGHAFSINSLARVERYLSESLHYSPDNPWAHEQSGYLQLSISKVAVYPIIATAAARRANIHFQRALEQRPTWAIVWAGLATSQFYLGDKADQIARSLGYAERQAPWQPQVQQRVALVGLSIWNRLSPAQRQNLRSAIETGARQDPAGMINVVKQLNRPDLACAIRSGSLDGNCNSRKQPVQQESAD